MEPLQSFSTAAWGTFMGCYSARILLWNFENIVCTGL